MFPFDAYLQQLQALDLNQTLLTSNRVVLLLSGSSHLSHASLSPSQQEFLSIGEMFGYEVVPSNFPYNKNFDYQRNQFPPLFQASLSNCLYYYQTHKSRAFQTEIIRHLTPLSFMEKVVIVTQSSGLHLLTQLPKEFPMKHVKILAVGPVSAKKVPDNWHVSSVKGTHDIYARILDCHKPDHLVVGGHHNYLANHQVKEILYDILQKN